MARIRTIKPDFWDSPATGKASLRARLLFIAMWNWADDFGIGDAHSGRLWNFAFPNDDRNPDDILEEAQERFAGILDGYLAEGFTQTAPIGITIAGYVLTLSTQIKGPPGWGYNTKRTEES